MLRPPREAPGEVGSWERALRGEPPSPQESTVTYFSGSEPSEEYLLSLIAELDSAEVSIKVQAGQFCLSGKIERLKAETIAAVKKCKPYLIEAYQALKGDIPDAPRPLPDRGRSVEWAGWEDEGFVIDGSILDHYDWVRWRYVGSRTWHAWSGHTWEE